MSGDKRFLLSIVELGGYPVLDSLYQTAGFETQMVTSMRKALSVIKKHTPDVIVAEFNFQSDFRDRTSSLETLLASIQKHPHIRVIVLYDKEYRHQLDRLLSVFSVTETLAYPIDENRLLKAIQ